MSLRMGVQCDMDPYEAWASRWCKAIYIREAENPREGLGKVFPALPPVLTGVRLGQRLGQKADLHADFSANMVEQRGIEFCVVDHAN